MARIKYREALRDALREEMERDPSVFCIGEGIGERGGSYKVTEGLFAQFGPRRVIDTPLSEAGFVGLGAGAAIAGSRPVVEMLFIDFLLLAMDQVVNQAAKYRFMSGGQGHVPLVVRTQGGAGNSLAGQHSQSLEALFYHVPGLKVVMPSTPADAKGLLKSAIRDDDPVIFIEHKLLYMTEGEVPRRGSRGPARAGRRQAGRHGRDARQLVAHGHEVPAGSRAARWRGDLRRGDRPADARARWTVACVLESVGRTGRLVVAQEAVEARRGRRATSPPSSPSRASTSCGRRSSASPARTRSIPFNLALERASVPQVEDVVAGIRAVMAGR